MAEITSVGYKLKTQNEYFADEVALYKSIDPQWDLDPSTPDGLKAAHDAEIFYALDEAGLRAYNSKDPEKAQGIELDIICALSGVIRKAGTRSDVTVRFYGNPGALVLSGAVIESTQTGERWVVEQTYTVQPEGYIDVQAFASSVGPTSAEAGTLTKIVTVMSGITSCTNITAANLGLDPETDASLRIRRRRAVGKPSNNQLDSMYAALIETKDVRRVAVYNNPTGSNAVSDDNPHGLPAHSIAVIVDGGEDADVGMSMYLHLNPGTGMAQPAGGTSVTIPVTSPVRPSNIQIVKFERPGDVDIELDIEVSGDSLPEDIEQQIKDAVMDYAVGSLLDPSVGFRSVGFDIGDSVPYSAMFTPVNKVVGQYGNSFVQSLTLNGGTSNVAVEFNEISRWQEYNITVTVV